MELILWNHLSLTDLQLNCWRRLAKDNLEGARIFEVTGETCQTRHLIVYAEAVSLSVSYSKIQILKKAVDIIIHKVLYSS